jgi:putative MFS transporter
MPGQTSDELLALFDSVPLNRRYWVSFILLSALFVLEFFDFLVVGYLLAVLAPQWHLTYGQSAVILYSGGIGAIVGALVFGGLSDAWGRKSIMIIGTFICAASSGLMGVVPSGAWEVFAVLRFLIGVGLTAGVTPSLAIQVELTPTRHRTLLTSFYLVFASAGGFLASFASAILLAPLGWRGVAMLGMAPAIAGILIWFCVPESVRWLTAKGRFAEAREEVAKQLGLPLHSVPLPTQLPAAQPRGSLWELYQRPSLFWETVITWAAPRSPPMASICGGRRSSPWC